MQVLQTRREEDWGVKIRGKLERNMNQPQWRVKGPGRSNRQPDHHFTLKSYVASIRAWRAVIDEMLWLIVSLLGGIELLILVIKSILGM